jgi:prephenate dehydratase
MAAAIRRVAYFYAVVDDRPGEAYQLLAHLASGEVNLLAFNGIPLGMEKTQLVFFPEDEGQLEHVAAQEGLTLTGPQHAFLIQGDNELGALVEYHRRLYEAGLNVVCASGVTDGRGGFGYIIYVRHEDFERAAQVLGL